MTEERFSSPWRIILLKTSNPLLISFSGFSFYERFIPRNFAFEAGEAVGYVQDSLEPSEERMQGTREYLKKLDPGCVHACHCTDLNSKIELSKVCILKEVGVGLQIEYF